MSGKDLVSEETPIVAEGCIWQQLIMRGGPSSAVAKFLSKVGESNDLNSDAL